MKSLLVYCGSRFGHDPENLRVAKILGEQAAARGCRIVYGGGKMGLMGATAGAARDAGGRVFGVIPEFLVAVEGILDGVDHKVVQTMHERKMLMFEECDAIVALPGGIGTLEELIETISWARLALHHKPIMALNTKGYWEPLRALLQHLVDTGFASKELMGDLLFIDTPEGVLDIVMRPAVRAVG